MTCLNAQYACLVFFHQTPTTALLTQMVHSGNYKLGFTHHPKRTASICLSVVVNLSEVPPLFLLLLTCVSSVCWVIMVIRVWENSRNGWSNGTGCWDAIVMRKWGWIDKNLKLNTCERTDLSADTHLQGDAEYL